MANHTHEATIQSDSTDPIAAPDLRVCLCAPISEVAIAAGLLYDAVTAHLDGRFSEAEDLLVQANIAAVKEWAELLIGKFSEFNTPRFRLSSSSKVAAMRENARMPSSEMKRTLHTRYGNYCCFCGTPIIRRQVRKRLVSLYPKAVPWGSGNAGKHAAVFLMEAQYDHVVPYSRGGENSLENILLTCLPCNYGRGGFTLEEMGLFDPRTRKRVECVVSDWDGLERLLQ
jgi:hypothetical protein